MNIHQSEQIFPGQNLSEDAQVHLQSRIDSFLTRPKCEQDPFGYDEKSFIKRATQLFFLYQHYFRVRSYGHEHLSNDQTIVIANHSGQLPMDALLLTLDYFLSSPEPKVLRSMVERFVIKLPFVGKMAQEAGAVLGDRQNAQYLLEKGESLLIFPEGARGISKPTPRHYHLETFSTGYVKMALARKCSIQPVVIIGAEELYPWVWNFSFLAKFLSIPAMPLAFPNGLIPLPAPIDIYYGERVFPYEDLGQHPDHRALVAWVARQQQSMQVLINTYLPTKRKIVDEELKGKVKNFFESWSK